MGDNIGTGSDGKSQIVVDTCYRNFAILGILDVHVRLQAMMQGVPANSLCKYQFTTNGAGSRHTPCLLVVDFV